MNKLVVIGAGGHGRVVADVAKLCGYDDILFLDDSNSSLSSGKVSDYIKYDADFFVAIGNCNVRKKFQNMIVESGRRLAALIHPNAVIGSNVTVGKGTVVMAGAVINTGTTIGEGVIINTSSSVDHDCVIEDFCHISVGAHIAGTVHIGANSMICAGATVINNINICNNCTVGAGAVVIDDIKSSGVYAGVPAGRL